MITALSTNSKPVARIEVQIEKAVKAELKPSVLQTEEKEKDSPKLKLSGKLSSAKYRSPYSIDNVIKTEVSKDGGEAELLGGDDMPKTPFGQEQVDRFWKLFVQNHVDKKNRSLYTTLNQRVPELKSHFKLVFPIENRVQLNQIELIKVDLVNYLRKHLNNYAVNLELPIRKLKSKKHIFSDEEKYKALANKYPLLENLREKLDLDFNS